MENEMEKVTDGVEIQEEAQVKEEIQEQEAQPAMYRSEEAPRVYTPEKPKRKKKGGARLIAIALICSLLGGALGAGGMYVGLRALADGPKGGGQTNLSGVLEGLRENTVIDITKVETGKLLSAAEVFACNVNSTVSITTTFKPNMWGQSTGGSSGSGFVLTQDGYVLTNHHVIEDANKITVTTYGGTEYSAKLIGYNEKNDIAVLKVNAKDLSPVILGNSDNLNVGDSVLAIGNPLGELPFTLTAGMVSGKDRTIPMSNGNTMQLLQTDCPINSGNSGGALFNMYGEVVGITNAKYSTSATSGQASIDNIGFAIPINQVRDMVFSIIEKGYVAKPYVGITVYTVTEQMQTWGVPKGAAISGVEADSPAAKAGLRVDDIVTAINGTPIATHTELVQKVGQMAIGSSVTLTIYRNRQSTDVTITIGEQIASATE